MKRLVIIILILLQLPGLGTTAAETVPDTIDHGLFASLLAEHVKNGRVDYQRFKAHEALLDAYLNGLAGIDPESLDRSEQFAFFINLYNAWTIKLILTHYPDLVSIKDLGRVFQSPWQKKIVRLHNRHVTLDHLEHDILRPRFKDPRVHFAINCASKSCPPLLNEPFTGENLETQLQRVTRNFINDPKNNYFKDDTLYVSRIFKWFRDDFDDIIAFFKKYAINGLQQQLDTVASRPAVKYLRYDWTLNDAAPVRHSSK